MRLLSEFEWILDTCSHKVVPPRQLYQSILTDRSVFTIQSKLPSLCVLDSFLVGPRVLADEVLPRTDNSDTVLFLVQGYYASAA